MNIFVSNINYVTKDYQLQDLFSEFGEVTSCKIITDKETGRSRGFGFVEMSDEEGQQAVEALNGKEFNGKELNVSEAKPREEKPRRSFDNNRGGGYGNRGGYGNNRGGNDRGGSRW
ncbi:MULTISPECIES: RNA recognition motif domain-containing protein [Cloacibacterium]|jgi:RNA recognition motif-containing protein|uniref:RNA recognition motif family protein n=2 Tax=root TaxID=1 RepID=A0A1E5UEP2_9FLAO|nr:MULTISPECIES: RNA-binding protein [Cloacibacterium]AZI69155.1 RNA-binding protein [Cloacibacterium normanense]MBV2225194.1 RNA-binding protein [Cloacibacterium sp.]OEL11352.1 RNA recognition motif family protein [Cloacibacterium normanense]SDO14474.1 RNA recognition motif. (a.k.a. RRM, RBD, or RNP domain) [Cloacibacterium normanense]